MGVSENRGPQYSTLSSRILIIRHVGHRVEQSYTDLQGYDY